MPASQLNLGTALSQLNHNSLKQLGFNVPTSRIIQGPSSFLNRKSRLNLYILLELEKRAHFDYFDN